MASAPSLDPPTINEECTDSLDSEPREELSSVLLSRRLGTLMLFRVVLISIVLGATTLVYWLEDSNLSQPNTRVLYGIIGATYFLTLVYALLLRRQYSATRLASFQVVGDIAIAALLLHVTGGVQSAYSFFFPLAIIGGAVLHYRRGAIFTSALATLVFALVGVLGWTGIFPSLEGQALLPTEPTTLEFARSFALNMSAIIGVSALSINLGAQLEASNVVLESHRSAAADLITLHRDIVHSLASGVITTNLDGTVTSFNDAARTMLAIPSSLSSTPMLHELSEELSSMMESVGPADSIRRGEIHLQKKHGDMVLGISITPLVDHQQSVLGRIINFQDLSEMRNMEAHVRRSERLAVIGGLAAGVAHEIRNPLASISGSIELLASPQAEGEDNRALMSIVTREVDRLNGLITEFLDYSSPRALERMPTDISHVIEEILYVYRQDKQVTDIELRADLPDQPLVVSVDREKLSQAFWNILRNAVEAAAVGQRVVQVTVSSQNGYAQVAITDTGPGIGPDKIERIFDPFFTTKAEGTGLGLATAHSIIHDHGGTVHATSPSNEGATFTIRLPLNVTAVH